MSFNRSQLHRIEACIARADHIATTDELEAAAAYLAQPVQSRQASLPFQRAANAGLITGGHPDPAGCCIASNQGDRGNA